MKKHNLVLLACSPLVLFFFLNCNPVDTTQKPDPFTQLALELNRSPRNFSNNPLTVSPVQLHSQQDWEDLLFFLGSKGRYVNLDISPSTGMTVFNPGRFPNGKELVVSLVLPDSAVAIPDAHSALNPLATPTFMGFTRLRSISGKAVETLGNFSFARSNLINVDFPALTTIGNSAFRQSPFLTSITIPAGVTSIGNMAFEGCFNLTTVTFAGNIPQAGFSDNAFIGNLRDRYFDAENGGPGTYTRAANSLEWTRQD